MGWSQREKPAQLKANAWADANGVPHTTMTLRGRRGWPDEVYWLPLRPLLIEFKAPGEVPRPLQLHTHEILRRNAYEVQVHDDAAAAVASLKEALASRRRQLERARALGWL